jgi:hypothetical protein
MKWKGILFNLLGLMCCLVPPVIVTSMYFPVWKDTVGIAGTLGGGAAVVAIVAYIVLSKYMKVKMQSPSPVLVFTVLYAMFYLMQRVITGLTVVAFWGMIGSAAGVIMFAVAKKYEVKNE